MKVKLSEQGFSYIDVMIAVVVLLVGILALLSAITGAVFQSRGQEQQLNAKQVATSTLESIMSVKETDRDGQLGWVRIGNVGTNPINGVNQGIFVTGFQNVTSDAGPDEVIGTADDAGTIIPGFRRQIVIRDECDTSRPSYNCPTPGTWLIRIRSVEVTITYFVGTVQRQEVLTTVLTDYAVKD
jgi:type II secretory pathway pseudopilin PulG